MGTMKVSDLVKMSPTERRAVLSTANGAVGSLRTRIATLETRYEMGSVEMRRRFASGEMPDTADTSEWLMLLRALDRVG